MKGAQLQRPEGGQDFVVQQDSEVVGRGPSEVGAGGEWKAWFRGLGGEKGQLSGAVCGRRPEGRSAQGDSWESVGGGVRIGPGFLANKGVRAMLLQRRGASEGLQFKEPKALLTVGQPPACPGKVSDWQWVVQVCLIFKALAGGGTRGTDAGEVCREWAEQRGVSRATPTGGLPVEWPQEWLRMCWCDGGVG